MRARALASLSPSRSLGWRLEPPPHPGRVLIAALRGHGRQRVSRARPSHRSVLSVTELPRPHIPPRPGFRTPPCALRPDAVHAHCAPIPPAPQPSPGAHRAGLTESRGAAAARAGGPTERASGGARAGKAVGEAARSPLAEP